MQFREFTPEELLGWLNEAEGRHAPKRLFAAGDVDMLRGASRVSIVGSRKATEEGLCQARRLSAMLAEKGVVVVSGLAEGIDTAAHTAAVQARGRTLAVVGTPLDQFYPKVNTGLQRYLMENQLVLSQFREGTRVQRSNFPIRNLTMALISDATIIIEASESSGSLHQGWEALRLGRPLFIASSMTESPSLTWPSRMINYGAYILSDESIDELFELLPERGLPESYYANPF